MNISIVVASEFFKSLIEKGEQDSAGTVVTSDCCASSGNGD